MLSDDQLLTDLEQEFANERKASHNILLFLKEVSARRLYAKRGFPNLFSMLVGHFHQSESAARQRLKAIELMKDVPVVEERLVSGDLSLSTVAMAQRQILREEKLSHQKVSVAKKMEIVESITGKTMVQAEIELFKHLPATASVPETFERRVAADLTRLNLTIPDDVRDMLVRLKEIWPDTDYVEVIKRSLKLALEKVDPTRKTSKTAVSVKRRGRVTYYGRSLDQALWRRAGSRCEYIDKKTGRRCEARHHLQREHVIPLALGGTNELSNMQLLCRTHNLLRARQVFGDAKLDHYIRQFG